MEYKSKFKAQEIDALLDKVNQGETGGGGDAKRVYYFHLPETGKLLNQDYISELETAVQQGAPFESVLTLAKDMLQENNEILSLIKEKSISVYFEIGGLMIAAMKAAGQEPSQLGMVSMTIPAVAQYVGQRDEVIQIISIPIKDGLLEYIANARYIYRKIIENNTTSETFIKLTKEEATYRVPKPGGTINDTARQHNLKVLEYEQYADTHYVYTPNYQSCPVISQSRSGIGKSLYYMEDGELLHASVNKETGDVVVTSLHSFNS